MVRAAEQDEVPKCGKALSKAVRVFAKIPMMGPEKALILQIEGGDDQITVLQP